MRYSAFLILTLYSLSTQANSAQPGFWSAGGAGTFSLLFLEDEQNYKKIQMVNELVSIQLYQGYAVVKGTYWMYNDTDSLISIKAGYPLNTIYEKETEHYTKTDIRFDSLYGLKVFVNTKPTSLATELQYYERPHRGSEQFNWYVWQTNFPAQDTTIITVYFIVNTNNAHLRDGYAMDDNNGFIYLLESGNTWKQPIVQGEIRIELKDEIEIDDLSGIRPDSIFKINEDNNQLIYRFKNLSPTDSNNIIIHYTEKIERFDFEAILEQEHQLYSAIDDFSKRSLSDKDFISYKFDSPFDAQGIQWSNIVFILIFIGIPLACIALFVFLIIRFIKFLRS